MVDKKDEPARKSDRSNYFMAVPGDFVFHEKKEKKNSN